MAYLVSNGTAEWIRKVRGHSDMSSTPRRGWIFEGEGESSNTVKVCLIVDGDSLTGYNALAYNSMYDLRGDEEGTKGTPVRIFPVEIGLDGNLPGGSIVLCHLVRCRVTGGVENSEPEQGGD